jgi:uncharacterized protein YndB with AHSA1/START domain
MRDKLLSQSTTLASIDGGVDRLSPCAASSQAHFEAVATNEVKARVEIAAEWRRIFSALSIPEYIEAWMNIAEETGSDHWVPLGPEGMLCVSTTRSAATVSIYRLRLHIKRNSLSFFWESMEPNNVQASRVDIVLKRGQRRCTLQLRHSGLRNSNEEEVYSRMWRRSLGNLQNLMQ